MKTKTILGICLSLCVWSFAGCGDDETIDIFPEGTASLRMMNEDNGKTLLGNSDVYITNAPEVAVQPRHGYVICTADDVRSFPSGQQAICENANIYRVFVDSWIEDKEGKAIGANVYFLLGKPEADEGIPFWDSEIEWQYDPTKENPLELTLPSDDIEVEILGEAQDYNYLAYSMRGRILVFRIENPSGLDATYQVRIRCQNIYTEVTLSLKNIW